MRFKSRLIPLFAAAAAFAGSTWTEAAEKRGGAPAPDRPAAIGPCSSPDPMKCKVCRPSYEKALACVRDKVKSSTFPVKMVAGWLFLADERCEKELKHCVDCAVDWRKQRGWRAGSHPENWYPALAAVFLAEYYKYRRDPEVLSAMNDLVGWFVSSQEPQNDGWWKWKEGAYKERLDYPVVNHGFLTALVMTFFHTARAHGVNIPEKTFQGGESALLHITTDRGIGYGLPRKGGNGWGDKTGARGAWVIQALAYTARLDHKIWKVYERILTDRIPQMDQGHHVGAFHGLAVVLGCHVLGPSAYKKLTDQWLRKLMAKQGPGGDLYIGDDGDAGGEPGLLRGNVGSTAAYALLIRLQDPRILVPKDRARRADGALVMRMRKAEPVKAKSVDYAKRRAEEAEKRKRRQEAQKAAKAEAGRVWDARLLDRVREAVRSGEKVSFPSGMLGGTAVITKAGDRGTLQVATKGGSVSVSLELGSLPMTDRRELAVSLLRKGNEDDHGLAAFYCLATGKIAQGEKLLDGAGSEADRIRRFFK
jgi:hypothetical protein